MGRRARSSPIDPSATAEELFLQEVGETFLLVGNLRAGWEEAFRTRLRSTRFLRPSSANDHQGSALRHDLNKVCCQPSPYRSRRTLVGASGLLPRPPRPG